MKYLFAATFLLASSGDAFLAPSTKATSCSRNNHNALKMSETDEVTKLREMAAKLRDDADRLNKVSKC